MTDSIKNARKLPRNPPRPETLPRYKFKSPNSQFEFVTQDTEKSEFLDLVDVGGVAIWVESVVQQKQPKLGSNVTSAQNKLQVSFRKKSHEL